MWKNRFLRSRATSRYMFSCENHRFISALSGKGEVVTVKSSKKWKQTDHIPSDQNDMRNVSGISSLYCPTSSVPVWCSGSFKLSASHHVYKTCSFRYQTVAVEHRLVRGWDHWILLMHRCASFENSSTIGIQFTLADTILQSYSLSAVLRVLLSSIIEW